MDKKEAKKWLATGLFGSYGVIGYMPGKLSRGKGTDTFLKAIEYLPKNVCIIICGSGPMKKDLEEYMKNTKHDIRFYGRVPHETVLEIMAACDVYVACSSWAEPFGRTLVEAMQLGVPVVATNVGGHPEIIDHGKNGFLVPPNDPRALAEAIIKLLPKRYLLDLSGIKGIKKR